jgi:hypothetical protein
MTAQQDGKLLKNTLVSVKKPTYKYWLNNKVDAIFVTKLLTILNQDAISPWTMTIQPERYEDFSVLTVTIDSLGGILKTTEIKLDELLNT